MTFIIFLLNDERHHYCQASFFKTGAGTTRLINWRWLSAFRHGACRTWFAEPYIAGPPGGPGPEADKITFFYKFAANLHVAGFHQVEQCEACPP